MKKRFILCGLFLVACNSGITSTINNSSFVSSSMYVSDSISSESSINSISNSSNESIVSSDDSLVSEEDTPKSRHDYYLEYSKLDKWYAIPIQGKLLGYEQYKNSPNCNAWLQEGKYGYYVINLPLDSIEIGKSYQIYGNACERSYYGINAKSDYFYCIECEEILTEEINLNNEIPLNDDYIGSKVSYEGIIQNINNNVMTVNINDVDYELSYNNGTLNSNEISSCWLNYQVGDTIKGEGILHSTNRQIRIIDVDNLIK